MLDSAFFRKSNRTTGKSSSGKNGSIHKIDRLPVGKIKGRWKNDAQIVTDPGLRQWHSVAIRDLASGRRNAQGVGRSLTLRLPTRRHVRWIGRRRLLRPPARKPQKQRDACSRYQAARHEEAKLNTRSEYAQGDSLKAEFRRLETEFRIPKQSGSDGKIR
jgi:hypothetical protein